MTAVEIPVSVMIFTLDEEANLPACLDSLAWCEDVVVVDSFSTDRTAEICRERGVSFHQHAFEGFGRQRMWALDNVDTRHQWVLVLDADERVPETMVEELSKVLPSAPPEVAAFRVRRRFHMWRRWLRHSSLYPTWVVRLVRKGRVAYENRGHAETQVIDGETRALEAELIDENLKGLDAWFSRQSTYARRDAEEELAQTAGRLSDLWRRDPLSRRAALKRLARRLPARGPTYFLYSYILRLGFLEGRDGFTFCLMRAMYQTMVQMHKYDIMRARNGTGR